MSSTVGLRNTSMSGDRGYSAIELLFAIGIILSLSAAVVPQTRVAIDRHRTVGAVRYLAGRLQHARLEAVLRSAAVGVYFIADDGGYSMTTYLDGNGDGVRTADIRDGTDRPIERTERLVDRFGDVDFGLYPNVPSVDSGGQAPSGDPIKLGSSDILSFSPTGSSSSGSLYVRGPAGRQMVVRIYGATGKIRALELNQPTATWEPL